jgi:hypothetical protein
VLRFIVTAAATAAALLGVLVFSHGGGPTTLRPVAKPKPPLVEIDGGVGGRLYFAARLPRPDGGVAREESVYRLAPGDRAPVRMLPAAIRTWHVSAWDDLVVVNTEGSGLLAPAGTVALDPTGLSGQAIADDAHIPVAGPGGRIAYLGFVSDRAVSAAFVRWGPRGRFRPVVRGGIGDLGFLPDARLAVLQRHAKRPWVVIAGRHGVQHRFRVAGSPGYGMFTTRSGLIGYQAGTDRIRAYSARGRLRASIDVHGWLMAGTRGDEFVLTEKAGDRIATVGLDGHIDVVGRHDPRYEVFTVQWEPPVAR